MKKVEFTIDENEKLQGVKTISLVDAPAIESDFVYFSKEKTQFIELKGEYKQIVAGLALIPNKYILRYDGLGEPYYGYFSADTIEKIRTKFHREKLGSLVNTDHNSSDYIDAFLIESFIVDSEQRLADVKAKGIEEVTLGSWYVSYKIQDPETFKRVVSGELRGFSVEVFLQNFCKVDSINNNEINYKEEMSNILQKFKELLSELEAEKTVTVPAKKFDQGATADGIILEYGAIGEPVNIIAADGSTSAAPDGDYTLDSGFIITVAAGVATDIQPVSDMKTEVKPVDNSAELSALKSEVEKLKTELAKANNELKLSKEEVVKLSKSPAANSVSKKDVKVEQVDLSKLSNAELQKMKYKN